MCVKKGLGSQSNEKDLGFTLPNSSVTGFLTKSSISVYRSDLDFTIFYNVIIKCNVSYDDKPHSVFIEMYKLVTCCVYMI